MKYVKPTIRFYDKFDELDVERESYAYLLEKTDWNEIFTKNRVIVLAEPGYGKTRMLKEVVLESSSKNHEAVFIDLKMVNYSIEDYINYTIKKCEVLESLDTEEKVNKCQKIKTKNFTLKNSENNIICFDALDEVQIGETFYKLTSDLIEFSNKYEKCKILISCRTHHYKRYKSILETTSFKLCKIYDFQNEQIEVFLKKYSIESENIKNVMEKVSLSNFKNILGTPRYLYMFTILVEKEGLEKVLQYNRTDLFESFIYGELERESNQSKINIDIAVVKRVLEKLALIMEIYQSNNLTKDELLTYFDNIDSNLSRIFLEFKSWQFLRDKSLIKDNINDIQFENREFQEYLAAKELVRISKNEQALYDLVIDAELKEVIPSWFNTLGFFIEMDITKLEQFLEIGKHKNNSVQDEEYHKLLTTVNTNILENNTKYKIFDYIFNYYQKELIRIDFITAQKLSFYCDSSFTKLLLDNFNNNNIDSETKQIRIINTLHIIENIFQYGLLKSEREIYKNSLLELIKTCDEYVKVEILDALRYYGSFDIIKNIIQYYDTSKSRVLEHFILTLTELNPNSETALDFFIKGTKERILSSRYGLYKITDAELINKLINSFLVDNNLLSDFLYYESIFNEQEQILIENVKKVVNDSLLDTIKKFIYEMFKGHVHYEAWESEYVKELFSLLKSKRQNLLFDILSEAKAEGIELNQSMFQQCFETLITEQNMERFIEEIETFNDGRWYALNIFLSYKPDSDIYKRGISYLSKEYEEFEKRRREYKNKYPKQDTEKANIYDKFKYKLGSKDKGYYLDVFEYFLRYEQYISLKQEDEELLKDLVFKYLKTNPLEAKVRKGDSGNSFSITNYIHIFPKCLAIANKLNCNVSEYQQNILNFVPFAMSNDLELIFQYIKNIGDLDINPILEVYNNRQDDLPSYAPESFIRACEKFRIVSAIPILDSFVYDTSLWTQHRRLAIEISNKLKSDENKLKQYFENFLNIPEDMQLSEKANKLLIELNNKEAIKWRIKKIKEKAIKIVQQDFGTNGRDISEGESEFYHKEFAKPLLNINKNEFYDQFIDLLDYSFEKVKEDDQYWSYANYLWEIVCNYISNLKINGTYEPISNLEKHIYEKEGEKGTNWFKYRIMKLKREYSSFLSKPNDILSCVQQYNKVVTNSYLRIKDNQGLINLIKNVIDTDLRSFIEDEGYYREIEKIAGHKIKTYVKKYLKENNHDWLIQMAKGHQEDFIQKTLKIQFENILMKYGIRKSDIIREPQLLDDKRIDFRISYGFLGPVIIEIKTTSNKEIRLKQDRKLYKNKLIQYIKGYNASFCYFIIFQVSKRYKYSTYQQELQELYGDCEKLEILGLNCLNNGR